MPRLLERQEPLTHAGVDLEALDLTPAPLDALLTDGHDAGADRRARMRAANTARQASEAQHEAAKTARKEQRAWLKAQRSPAQQAQAARLGKHLRIIPCGPRA